MRFHRLVGLVIGLAVLATAAGAPAAFAAAPSVAVSGNRLVDGAGNTMQLRGVNQSGFEVTCRQPHFGDTHRDPSFGKEYGPRTAAGVGVMRTWGINAVRVPLNEHCWLGVNPVRRRERTLVPIRGRARVAAGRAEARRYRRAVKAYVRTLHSQGMVAILDLHWSAPGRSLANNQYPMADADYGPRFWRSVATTFRRDHSMIFDVFNEPLGISWRCLRDGCSVRNSCADCPTANHPHGRYRSAGTQRLVSAIRSTGATQPVMVPGLVYSHDLSRWLEFKPKDPRAQLVASFHNYTDGGPNPTCGAPCWANVIAPLAATHPVVTGEFGQFNCGRDWVDAYMGFADSAGVSYIAWSWFDPDPRYDDTCEDGNPQILDGYDGTPKAQTGVAIRDHYRARAGL